MWRLRQVELWCLDWRVYMIELEYGSLFGY